MSRSNSTKTTAIPNHVRQKVQSVSPAQIWVLSTWGKKVCKCLWPNTLITYRFKQPFWGFEIAEMDDYSWTVKLIESDKMKVQFLRAVH